MRLLITTITLILCSNLGWCNTAHSDDNTFLKSVDELTLDYNNAAELYSPSPTPIKKKCKIRVNGESNGNTYDFVIELEGISWFRCLTIKLADIFTKKF